MQNQRESLCCKYYVGVVYEYIALALVSQLTIHQKFRGGKGCLALLNCSLRLSSLDRIRSDGLQVHFFLGVFYGFF